MGKGRAPCCAKVGLNKGSWTPEEDMRLIAYIQKYGHANWRALPKQAGTYVRDAGAPAAAGHGMDSVVCTCIQGTASSFSSNPWFFDSIHRFAAVREELPAAVDQLPPPGPEARQLHRRRGGDHHQAPRHARQQVRTYGASSVFVFPTSRIGVQLALHVVVVLWTQTQP